MAITITHAKTVTIPDPTQAELDAQIALGNYPPGTTLADIALQSDWNDEHVISGLVEGHTIQDEGTPLTARANLNFVGTGVAVTDDAGNNATVVTITSGGGSGDVVGPASATDNAIARYDGTTGKLIQNSGATIDDSGNLTANNFSGTSSGTNTGDQTSIVGITGTKAQFDTACTDGNFLYVGDVVGLTDGDKGDIVVSSSGTVWAIDTGVIVNADINGSAAIDATKIHDGSISNTEFGYLNGVTSAIQTQINSIPFIKTFERPLNKVYIAVLEIPFACTLNSIERVSRSGTIDDAWAIGSTAYTAGTAITGGSGTISSTQGTLTLTANNSISAGQHIHVTFSSNSLAKDVEITINYTR